MQRWFIEEGPGPNAHNWFLIDSHTHNIVAKYANDWQAAEVADWLNTDPQTVRSVLNAVAHGVLSVDDAMKELATVVPPGEIE